MIFEKIFVEHQAKTHPKTQEILAKLNRHDVFYIDKVERIFQTVKKPYLQKHTSLNLFIGKKTGQLVKPAPAAYGHNSVPRYYFLHSYNCIYECEYCYLQGYFQSPDIVFFINHDEICREMETIANEVHRDQEVWFHAGEFSDSLALSHLSNEWFEYWQTFAKLEHAFLELRTKSGNINPIKDLPFTKNIIPSFSLAPANKIAEYEHKTATLSARLKAGQILADKGYEVGLHFDPIIFSNDVIAEYDQLLTQTITAISVDKIKYLSLGVVRFTKDVHYEVQKNYPHSRLLQGEFYKSFDGKVRYLRPLRLWLMKQIREVAIKKGIAPEKIYLCMEN